MDVRKWHSCKLMSRTEDKALYIYMLPFVTNAGGTMDASSKLQTRTTRVWTRTAHGSLIMPFQCI
jgi:hypothetical protein